MNIEGQVDNYKCMLIFPLCNLNYLCFMAVVNQSAPLLCGTIISWLIRRGRFERDNGVLRNSFDYTKLVLLHIQNI